METTGVATFGLLTAVYLDSHRGLASLSYLLGARGSEYTYSDTECATVDL